MPDPELVRQLADNLSRELADRGQIIEGGWRAYEVLSGLTGPDTPAAVRKELRQVYFLGAQHLFATILNVLDPGTEATEQDLRRMDKVNDELARFIDEYRKSRNQSPP